MTKGNAVETLDVAGRQVGVRSLSRAVGAPLSKLPYVLRVLAENALAPEADPDDLSCILMREGDMIEFRPSRLILQDMLALPLLLDLMLLREVARDRGAHKNATDLTLPIDLVIDHSMTVEHWASPDALAENQRHEFEVNRERFAFFKTCEAEFAALRVIPPGGGIMHQVNLEYLSQVAELVGPSQAPILQADTVLGTDSHTPMVNGLGVLGWGIGGLDAERITLGHRLALNVPEVVGLRLHGALPDSATATDIALLVTRVLREVGVVGAFVELCSDGYASLSVPDRATIANMAPEYGCTCVYCPIDKNTLGYLRMTGRSASHVARVEAWARHQALWRDPSAEAKIDYDRIVDLDLSRIGHSVAGPARPEQHVALASVPQRLSDLPNVRHPVPGCDFDLGNDDVIIAAITSCTNTANPRNMVTAGLIARNAVRRGLRVKTWVKTSLSPGSRVVAAYLRDSGLQADLDRLGFHVAGFACTTCNGMSGPLDPAIEKTIQKHDLDCAAVLSGNRNFAGRIHPLAAKNILAAPPLVVAYALAGSLATDIAAGVLGFDQKDRAVRLDDLWPDQADVDAILDAYAGPDTYRGVYANVADVSEEWNALTADGAFRWPEGSTYISRPPYLDGMSNIPEPMRKIEGLRPLVVLGDNITTDHISPSGYIPTDSAAGHYLSSRGVAERDFNSFGTRRGSNDIVVRSTFSSIRLVNEMVAGREGPWTRIFPSGRKASVFDAIEHYLAENTPLIVIAGKRYGAGSSRDTAAKAPKLAGVQAVLAESFERIHRSNLVNMGIAPLVFPEGVTRRTLRLDGSETFDLEFNEALDAAQLTIHRRNAQTEVQSLRIALFNTAERKTFQHGGALQESARALVA
ncbi:aconitate hydratase 1 [Rhodobacteraceae bacterium KLH11]|nr:aconitate hydratase 1 [Rhodobacteraceae bacterium KLH11]